MNIARISGDDGAGSDLALKYLKTSKLRLGKPERLELYELLQPVSDPHCDECLLSRNTASQLQDCKED